MEVIFCAYYPKARAFYLYIFTASFAPEQSIIFFLHKGTYSATGNVGPHSNQGWSRETLSPTLPLVRIYVKRRTQTPIKGKRKEEAGNSSTSIPPQANTRRERLRELETRDRQPVIERKVPTAQARAVVSKV